MEKDRSEMKDGNIFKSLKQYIFDVYFIFTAYKIYSTSFVHKKTSVRQKRTIISEVVKRPTDAAHVVLTWMKLGYVAR